MAEKKPTRRLRTVAPGEKAPAQPKVHTRIVDALEGSGRDVLASMRKALAKKLDEGDVSSNAIASAYKELRELDRLIRQRDAAAADEAKSDDGNADDAFDSSAI
jgi:hypothetical protein